MARVATAFVTRKQRMGLPQRFVAIEIVSPDDRYGELPQRQEDYR